jgi:HlyD family secretion protein
VSSRSTRIAVAGVTAAVVAGGAGTYAALASSGPSYRLARVTSAHVASTLAEVGTLNPVRQADVAFAAGGTVASVAVSAGQHVTAGRRLGSLDTTSLASDLTAAKLTLANANLQVANDITSQNGAAQPSAAAPSAPATPAGPALQPLQQAVLAAQRTADSALAQAAAAFAQAQKACAPAPVPAGAPATPAGTAATPAGTPTGTAASSPPASETPAPAPTPSPAPSPVSCTTATALLFTDEVTVQQAQQALSSRLAALSAALGAGGKPGSSGGGSHSGGSGSGGSGSGSGSGGSGSSPGAGGSTGSPVSAAQLAADQASADAAAAQVTAARQSLAAATVVSPITGTVVSVNVTAGSATGAGSTAFVIAGLGTYQVQASVAVTDMPKLKVGQRASVLPDGRGSPLPGTVASIGLVPDPGSSPATYPVVIGLTGPYSGLHAGGYASVTITTAVASGVSVPTAAVHGSGHATTVTVYSGGMTHDVKVTVGTVGPVMTRITSGLSLGEQVVLADLSRPLPTANPFPGGGPGGQFFGPGQARRVINGGP